MNCCYETTALCLGQLGEAIDFPRISLSFPLWGQRHHGHIQRKICMLSLIV